MKKICLIIVALLCLCGCQKEEACDVNAGMICVDELTNEYILEDEAVLTVSVHNEAYGEALKALWDKTYPEHQGALNIVLAGAMDGKDWLDKNADVGLIYSSEAARLNQWFLPIGELTTQKMASGLVSQYGESVNVNQMLYVPMSGYGWIFSYHRTMLNELGFELKDENQDGVPDEFDTFEEIGAWADSLKGPLTYRQQEVNQVFEFNWKEPSLAMTWLSAGGFTPFATMEAEQPGWLSEEFLSCITDLKALGKYQWTLGEESIGEIEEDISRQQSSTWGSEFYLSSADSVFSMVGTWMYYDDYESLNEEDFGFSMMPTLNGYPISPYTLSFGYVIRKDTAYPNACYQLLSLIRSDEGLKIFAENSDTPLLYNYNEDRTFKNEQGEIVDLGVLELTFKNENLKEISRAMMSGKEESMVAFVKNPEIRGWDMIEEAGIYNYLRRVFEQTISLSAAQSRIADEANAWMKPYLILEEETE